MPAEMRTVEAPLVKAQRRTGLEAVHVCLANHVTVFSLCPENSSEAASESNGRICLLEGISRKDSIQVGVREPELKMMLKGLPAPKQLSRDVSLWDQHAQASATVSQRGQAAPAGSRSW